MDHNNQVGMATFGFAPMYDPQTMQIAAQQQQLSQIQPTLPANLAIIPTVNVQNEGESSQPPAVPQAQLQNFADFGLPPNQYYQPLSHFQIQMMLGLQPMQQMTLMQQRNDALFALQHEQLKNLALQKYLTDCKVKELESIVIKHDAEMTQMKEIIVHTVRSTDSSQQVIQLVQQPEPPRVPQFEPPRVPQLESPRVPQPEPPRVPQLEPVPDVDVPAVVSTSAHAKKRSASDQNEAPQKKKKNSAPVRSEDTDRDDDDEEYIYPHTEVINKSPSVGSLRTFSPIASRTQKNGRVAKGSKAASSSSAKEKTKKRN